MLHMRRLASRAEVHADNIDAHPFGVDASGLAVVHGALPHSPQLDRAHRFGGEAGSCPARPHLNENHVASVVRHDVDLAAGRAHVPRNHAHAACLKAVGGYPLPEFAQPLALVHRGSVHCATGAYDRR